MALELASDYVNEAGVLLNDIEHVRYTQSNILAALYQGLADMYRLRPDIFMDGPVPTPIVANTSLIIVEDQFRPTLLNYVVGYCENIDQETSDMARGTAYYAKFISGLIGGSK